MYRIRGLRRGERLTETRILPASAGVLATKWVEEGCTEVEIEDDGGQVYTLATFQQRLRSRRESAKLW